MLDRLRRSILALTEDRKNPAPSTLARTIVCLLSPELARMETWYKEWFPLNDSAAATFHRWLVVRETGEFQHQLDDTLDQIFALPAIQNFEAGGRRLQVGSNQVVLVYRSSPGSDPAILANVGKILNESLARIASPLTPFFKLGVVLQADGAQAMAAGDLQHILSPLALDRLFLIQHRNQQGITVSREEDMDSLACQLVRTLARWAGEMPSERYGEWVKSASPADGWITGGAAFSLVMPIDAIIEGAALSIGGDVLKKALLEGFDPEALPYFLQRFLSTQGLSSFESLVATLYRDKTGPLEDPISRCPSLDRDRPEDYIASVDALDASLPATSMEYYQAMEAQGKTCLSSWRNALEEHIHSILTTEPGGLVLTGEFLNALVGHLETLVPQAAVPQPVPDPAKAIRSLKALLDRLPTLPARFSRATVLSVVLALGILLVNPEGNSAVLAPVGFLLPLALSLVMHWLRAHEVENGVLEIKHRLGLKWRALIGPFQRKACEQAVQASLGSVRGLQSEVDRARRRAEELAIYFKENRTPPLPEEFAFWRYAPRDPEPLRAYREQCSPDVSARAVQFVRESSPLEAWRRFDPPVAAPAEGEEDRPEPNPPNNWEWRLFEKAALTVLPDCMPLVSLTLEDFLASDEQSMLDALRCLVQGTEPFLRIPPGHGMRRAWLEAGTDPKRPVPARMREAVQGHYADLECIPSISPYRITFLGLLEQVPISEVDPR